MSFAPERRLRRFGQRFCCAIETFAMTKPQLKVVSSGDATPVRHPRPFEILYYSSIGSKPQEWAAKGRAASARGACRAAFLRVLEKRADKAVVCDESGTPVARIWREGRSITATGSAIVKGVL